MPIRTFPFLVPLAIVASLTAQAQAPTRQIAGAVVSALDGSPLPGVTIVVKGTTNGITTDPQGRFTLSVPTESDPTLVFSFIGYQPQEVKAGSRSTLDVVRLSESPTDLNAVVVVGYGTQKKRDITGSVSSITAEQVAETPIIRADQILQGRAAGVQVTQTNSEPGGGTSIRVRGTNSINSGNEPLFVVDGFPGAGDLNSINPNDIESIEVLKDASATAIYGSRGANGVVLITTKKGKVGRNTTSVEVYTGIQNVRKKYDLMNAQQFATYLNEVRALGNASSPTTALPLPYTQAEVDALGAGTDWQDAIMQQGRINNYQLGFNGGTEDTRYNLSFNFFDQTGTIINSGFKRGTIRFNLDKKLSNKLSFNLTSQTAATGEQRAFVNSQGGSFGGVLLDALRFNPAVPIYGPDGTFTYSNGPLPYVEDVGNPVAYATEAQDNRTVIRGLLNVGANYELVKGLTFRATGGIDYRNSQAAQFRPNDIFLGRNTNGSATRTNENVYSWVNENTLTYDRQFNPSNHLNAVAGASFQAFYGDNFSGQATNFFTNTLGTDNLGLGAVTLPPGSGRYKNTLQSYFGRINYQLFDRFLFTFTLRADGSSRFGENNKWGYFPSAAFGYRLVEEKFMQNLPVISELKLRASYGVTGNQEISNYQSLARYSVGAYAAGSTRLVGLVPANIANPNLTWESTASSDLGLDLGLFKNRVSFVADVYYKKTSDLLLLVSVPTTTGYSSLYLNAGSVENKGLELALNTVNFTSSKFSWSTNLNFSINRNKVLDLNGETERYVGSSSSSLFVGSGLGNTNVLRLGQSIGSFFGYQFDGLWQTQDEITASGTKTVVRPGDPRYVDQNGDKQITADDRVIIGHAQPDFIYGVTNTFKYKGFSLNVFVQGVQGSDVLNLNRYELESGITTTNKLASVVNRWTGPGTSNTIPRANSTLRRSTGIVSDVVEDGSFLRLKTLTVGYTVPLPASVKAIRQASVYLTAQNLVTFTKYSGYDPEVNSFGTATLSPNTDYNAYPSMRTFTAGVRLGF